MKQIICVVIALATVIVSGCSDGGDGYKPSYGANSLTIGLEPSRTTLGESIDGKRSLYWSAGDRIVADGVTSADAQFEGEKSSVAVFDFGDVALDYPSNILYPAAFYKDEATVTLPNVQSATINGEIATNTIPMACVATASEKPKLQHLAGVIHLQLRAENDTHNNNVRKVEFWGNDEEQVSGDFAIDYTTTTLTATSVKQALKKTSALVTGELSADVVTDVFVVVPAREYKNGFTVCVINEAGHFLEKVKPSSVTIHKGEILKQPEIVFIPTGTLIGVEIPNS